VLVGLGFGVKHMSARCKHYTHWLSNGIDVGSEYDRLINEEKSEKEILDALVDKLKVIGLPEGKFTLSLRAYIQFVLANLGKTKLNPTLPSLGVDEQGRRRIETTVSDTDETVSRFEDRSVYDMDIQRFIKKCKLSGIEKKILYAIWRGDTEEKIMDDFEITKEKYTEVVTSLMYKYSEYFEIAVDTKPQANIDAKEDQPDEVAQKTPPPPISSQAAPAKPDGVAPEGPSLCDVDIEKAGELMNKLIPAELKMDRVYEIRYDSSRLEDYQRESKISEESSPEKLLSEYVRQLRIRMPCEDPEDAEAAIKLIECPSRDNKERDLISVKCYQKSDSGTMLIGECHVNIEGDLGGKVIRMIGMLNMALAASNIAQIYYG